MHAMCSSIVDGSVQHCTTCTALTDSYSADPEGIDSEREDSMADNTSGEGT